ncbi:PPE family protein [Mycobacterium heidelbergense]|uniref:PPE family protein n=1 Tax=Mycobacterium heidelbergense TaxID=53376 RepID=UPI003CF46943
MDFAALPPEINSGRMHAGAGSGPMLASAAAWEGLAAELSSVATSYEAVVSGLAGGLWLGPASVSMSAAAAPYVAWMNITAEHAAQTASQARSAAAAYEAAFAAHVPPAVIAENRALLLLLVATDIFGQNSVAIAETEAQYAQMWAQDATAMYAYASASAVASQLTPFTAPAQNTNPAGAGAQLAAVSQASGTAVAGQSSSSLLPQLISAVPNVLQNVGSGNSIATTADLLNLGSGGAFVASGILYLLDPLLGGSTIGATTVPLASPGGCYGPGLGAPGLGSTAMAAGLGRTDVLASFGQAASISGLSVPPTWAAAAPAIARAATGLPAPTLAGLSEAGVDGLGYGYGGMLPGSLMAAAAGGGGAAGGGWAAKRAGAAAQRAGGAAQHGGRTSSSYGPPPMVISPVARAASWNDGTHSREPCPDQSAQQGAGPSREGLREEINDLRKQLAELAMERDVLMRSAALWAREAMER